MISSSEPSFLIVISMSINFVARRDNLQLLRQRYYYATWKADGTRYMMLITVDGCYLIDRTFTFRRVQMRFPCKSTNEVNMHASFRKISGLQSFTSRIKCRWLVIWRYYIYCKALADKTHHFTLLDGEMIIDTLPDTQKQERRYLIYDLMAINQISVVEVRFALKKCDTLPSWLVLVLEGHVSYREVIIIPLLC